MKVIPASKIPTNKNYVHRKEDITNCLPYWIVRTFNNNWKLRQQRIIRIGRLRFKVEEIQIKE